MAALSFPSDRSSVPIVRNPLVHLVVSSLLLASCAILPLGLRGKDSKTTATAEIATPPDTTADKAAAPRSDTPTGLEPRMYFGTGLMVNPKPTQISTTPGPEEASLNFEGLDVREVAKVILGDYLKQSYTVHPSVAGTVTFRTVRPIPMRELLPTLEMLLRQNNAAVVREEGIYKILPITAVRGSVSPQLGGVNQPIPPGYSIVVIPLKYVGAREMMRLMTPFAAENTIVPDDIRNLLVIAGNQREMKHLIDTVEMFDVDWLSGYSVGLFPVKSIDVKTLAADFEKVFGQASAPLAGVVRVIPVERMNALLVVTTQPAYLERAKEWLDRLDQSGGTSGGTRFFVYPVKNAKAENLAQLVGDLFASRRTTTTRFRRGKQKMRAPI